MLLYNDAGRLIILTAPSGAGKTTIAHALLKKMPDLVFSISATTRSPRHGELNGKDYYFLTVDDFKQKIDRGAFIEYEMVYEGKYYGTLYSELERIWHDGKYPLRVVDVTGALALKEKFGVSALSIFIQPPTLSSLKERLMRRGTEDAHSLQERLQKAHGEMHMASHFDHVVINDQLSHAVSQTAAIIRKYMETTLQ